MSAETSAFDACIGIERKPDVTSREGPRSHEDDDALLVLGRSLVAHAKAKAIGKPPGLSEPLGSKLLANVYVSPTPLFSKCRRSSVDILLQHTFTGFDESLLSKNVSLSADGKVARHLDPSGEVLYGIVFGNSVMPRFAEGAYFEVEITDTRPCQNDGLTIGVTSMLPYSWEQVPEAADALPDSWSVGYDGNAKIRGSQAMIPVAWSSNGLGVGDSVGLLIDYDGRPHLFVNRCLAPCKLPGKVPLDEPLFPFVDLLGNAREVLLKIDAKPPCAPLASALSVSADIRNLHLPLFFHKSLVGKSIKLSEDGLAAEHLDSNGDTMHGMVFLDRPLPCCQQGVYFEVRIDATRAGEIDGIVIGVTRKLPETQDLPEVADTLPRSWSFGYDGHARGPGRQMTPISWSPKDLRVADRVGLLVRPSGSAHLVINRSRAVDLPYQIPITPSLYGFVDLLGGTKAVRLMQGAQPPAFLDPEGGAGPKRRVSFAKDVS